ncbi:hypothetical protein CK203_058104 [Vitis vinifera]|uniref:Uncharacterized protein n=1 Tax=Vitis vinifera TaxID=29760 RepID=A0A438GGW4_VITVI|nr:hypothetical protein CK203_058104 [Vitis vinifera]
MGPRSTCPMLIRHGVTSIEVLCQAMHLFKHLDLCNRTLYSKMTLLSPQRNLLSVHSAIVSSANMDRSGVASTISKTQRGKAKSSQSGHSLTEH